MESIRIAIVLTLAVVAFFFVLKPVASRALRLQAPQLLPATAGIGGARTVADMEGEIEAQLLAGAAARASDTRRLPVLAKTIARGVEQQPEHAARLVRNWLIDEEKK